MRQKERYGPRGFKDRKQHHPRDRREPQMVQALGQRIALCCLMPQAAVRSREDQKPTMNAYHRALPTPWRRETDP